MSARAQSRVFDLRTAALEESSGIIGERRGLRRILDSVRTVVPTDTAVLITGETGTGKELIARAIHQHSPRSRGPFLKVNCAAIPAGLLENELFGHERGAFTGAFAQTDGPFSLPTKGRYFSTRLATCPSNYNLSYCAFRRNRNSRGSAAAVPSGSTSELSRPPTSI